MKITTWAWICTKPINPGQAHLDIPREIIRESTGRGTTPICSGRMLNKTGVPRSTSTDHLPLRWSATDATFARLVEWMCASLRS